MESETPPLSSSTAPRRLVVLALAVALGWLVVAGIPAAWLVAAAARMGHEDDATVERIARLRIISVALAAAHTLVAWRLARAPKDSVAYAWSQMLQQIRPCRLIEAAREASRAVREPGRMHAAALLIVLVAGAGIRLRYLNAPIDYDEAYSFLNFARRPLYQGLADFNTTNNHLLNTAFMHVEFLLFGPREWALRLHVFVAGVGLLWSTYRLGRTLLSPAIGLVAAAISAASFVLINYSVNARGYVWVAWMTVVLLDAVWKLARGAPCQLVANSMSAVTAAVVGLFASPIMMYPIVGVAGWLLVTLWLDPDAPAPALPLVGSLAAAITLATAWLYAPAFVLRGFEALQHEFVRPLPLSEWCGRFASAWSLAMQMCLEGPGHASYFAVVWGLMFVVVIGLGSQPGVLSKLAAPASLLASVVMAAVVLMALQRVAPPPRIFTFLVPFAAIVTAFALTSFCGGVMAVTGFVARRDPTRAMDIAAPVIAVAIVALGIANAAFQPLPGGRRPTHLIEDVASRPEADWLKSRAAPLDQLWRLSVPSAVGELEPELRESDQVLVALPADMPLRFYAARRGWSAAIGGDPQSGGRLFLVAPRVYTAREVLERNLALRFNDDSHGWLVNADWQRWRDLGELTVWQARPSAAPTE